ncbi:MAG: tRNA threonylcarbamoyladenosine dehydratase [Bacteroidales bacterium]|nr:tRNA threonylcarbamoyladenosine dehydratase [Bacteroidales bacterium]
MTYWDERTELLLGKDKLTLLSQAHVLVVGLGGVGAYATENLARAGIGRLTIADGDVIHPSNRNRQLLALKSSEGKSKAMLMEQRLKDINPDLEIESIDEYLRDEKLKDLVSRKYDYVVDAIDTLSPKVFLIIDTLAANNPLISSMGAGGKKDPAMVQIADISKSHSCPLAFYIRKRLHKRGIRNGFKVVFSPETIPEEARMPLENEPNKKTTVGTISYMPAIFGCMLASVVIRDLINVPSCKTDE